MRGRLPAWECSRRCWERLRRSTLQQMPQQRMLSELCCLEQILSLQLTDHLIKFSAIIQLTLGKALICLLRCSSIDFPACTIERCRYSDKPSHLHGSLYRQDAALLDRLGCSTVACGQHHPIDSQWSFFVVTWVGCIHQARSACKLVLLRTCSTSCRIARTPPCCAAYAVRYCRKHMQMARLLGAPARPVCRQVHRCSPPAVPCFTSNAGRTGLAAG